MKRYICIHGHFYQPPRENPWLEEIEMQDSAWPYHDWNYRITAECYAPNTTSRILDEQKYVVDIVNNYFKISFNFGPTLLSWLERNAPEVYQAVLEADRQSQMRFGGHGAAIAQAYNHIIMPLASLRDKQTQVIWGIADFEHRFLRKPEGMWISETAVDIETLEVLAEHGIKFTILAPHQAWRMRRIGSADWQELNGEKNNPKMAYLCNLPSGRSINLFFYDGPISREVAFSGLLTKGENFADKLTGAFTDKSETAQLVNIATDGETYGHHHRFGDMALAYGLHHIEKNKAAEITIYGEYLEKYPPLYEVEILEDSSWSCAHGIERWRSDCGCNIGTHKDWHQKWRGPLRGALDWLRNKLSELYEQNMPAYLADPWAARNEYIQVMLNRSSGAVDDFLHKHAVRELQAQEKVKVLKLLEIARNALLMYTSCGWFFDEVSGIETTQILSYAARALQLAHETAGWDLETEFIERLEKAPSNLANIGTAANLYLNKIKPEILDLLRVAAHYAISSVFIESSEEIKMFCYTAKNEMYERLESGKQKLVSGRIKLTSAITGEEAKINFAVVHFGDQNVIGGAKYAGEDGSFEKLKSRLTELFKKGKNAEVVHEIDRYFGEHNYSLWHLFKDEQRKIINRIAEPAAEEIADSLRRAMKEHHPIMKVMHDLGVPLPRAFYAAAKFYFNHTLRKMLEESREIDLEELLDIVDEIKAWQVKLDRKALGFAATSRINSLMQSFFAEPGNFPRLEKISTLLDIFNRPPLEFPLDLWRAQNIYFLLSKTDGIPDMQKGLTLFKRLGEQLKVSARGARLPDGQGSAFGGKS